MSQNNCEQLEQQKESLQENDSTNGINKKMKFKDTIDNQNTINGKVMVCVTRQTTCQRLIRQGAAIAQQLGQELIVVHALRQYERILSSSDESAALEMLFEEANKYEGQMIVIRCEDVLEGLTKCAKVNNVGLMILGASPQNAQSVCEEIRRRMPRVSYMVVDSGQNIQDQIA